MGVNPFKIGDRVRMVSTDGRNDLMVKQFGKDYVFEVVDIGRLGKDETLEVKLVGKDYRNVWWWWRFVYAKPDDGLENWV